MPRPPPTRSADKKEADRKKKAEIVARSVKVRAATIGLPDNNRKFARLTRRAKPLLLHSVQSSSEEHYLDINKFSEADRMLLGRAMFDELRVLKRPLSIEAINSAATRNRNVFNQLKKDPQYVDAAKSVQSKFEFLESILARYTKPVAPVSPATPKTKNSRGQGTLERTEKVRSGEPEETPVIDAEGFFPGSQRISLLELNEAKCHWPVGDPASPDFFFCGGKALAGLAYCVYHSRLAYQPAHLRESKLIDSSQHTDYTEEKPKTALKEEGYLDARLRGYLRDKKIPPEKWGEAAAGFARVLDEIQDADRPKWNDRKNFPELAGKFAPEFLRAVWGDKIINDTIRAEDIRDAALLQAMRAYRNNHKNKPSLGRAEGLRIIPAPPGRQKMSVLSIK
jgi:hypothetical protein